MRIPGSGHKSGEVVAPAATIVVGDQRDAERRERDLYLGL
jgi:hypothetical protein